MVQRRKSREAESCIYLKRDNHGANKARFSKAAQNNCQHASTNQSFWQLRNVNPLSARDRNEDVWFVRVPRIRIGPCHCVSKPHFSNLIATRLYPTIHLNHRLSSCLHFDEASEFLLMSLANTVPLPSSYRPPTVLPSDLICSGIVLAYHP